MTAARLSQRGHLPDLVTFTPTATGARTGTLRIIDNTVQTPQTVALSGTGGSPNFEDSHRRIKLTHFAGWQQRPVYAHHRRSWNRRNRFAECTGAPAGVTCSLPPTIALNANTPTGVTVSIATTARAGGSCSGLKHTFPPVCPYSARPLSSS